MEIVLFAADGSRRKKGNQDTATDVGRLLKGS
jgi:hypothetical protein